MTRALNLLILPALLALSTVTIADENQNNLILSIATGDSNIYVNSDHTYSGVPEIEDSLYVRGLVGYRWKSGFAIEMGAGMYLSPHWGGGGEDLNEELLMISYQFKMNSVRIIPRIGYAKWYLKSEKTATSTRNVASEGYDKVWSLDIEKDLSDRVSLIFSARNQQYDFGEVNSFAIGASWRINFP